MDYDSIRQQYRSVRRKILTKTNQLKSIDAELDGLVKSKKIMAADYEQNYNAAKEKSKEEYKQKMLVPLQDKLEKYQTTLDEIQKEYAESLEELTEEKLLEQYSSQQDILLEVRESTVALQAQLKETISEQFYNVLYQQLEQKQIKLEEADLDSVITYFNECSAKLDKVIKSKSPITTLVNRIEKLILESNLQIDSSNVMMCISLLYVVACLFLSKYVFPVYGFLLCFQAVYNVIHFYNIYKILVVQKSVQDNILLIDEKIHQEVLEDLAKRKQENEEYYQKEIEQCEGIIDRINNEMMQVSVSITNAFSFDDSSIKEQYRVSLSTKQEHESNLMENKYSLKKEIDKLQEDAVSYKEQLVALLNESVNFESVGTSNIFDPEFIIDIDKQELRRITFDFPQSSALYLYNSYNELYDFIRLINIQLRHKMNPFCFNVILYDDVMLGTPCIKFSSNSKTKGDLSVNLFKIITIEQDLKDVVDESVEVLSSRLNTIKREFHNIFDYNNKMIELESVPETYEFWFIIDPPDMIEASPAFQKLLVNGGDLGIFCQIFRNQESFYKTKDKSKDLLGGVNKAYLLQNGVINKVAKEKILETLQKTK